jgi:cytochrome c oxidase cbb3-type subunit 3
MRYPSILVIAAGAAIALTGCKIEQRNEIPQPASRATFVAARESPILPGGPVGQVVVNSPAEGKAYDIAEGQRLFSWYNCVGCHSHGGGGMGPPLMNQKFIYGSEPDNIFDTIVKGRPRGMPSWGGRIPQYQIWQIVAYVRSLSGQEPYIATPGRSNHMETKTAAQLK